VPGGDPGQVAVRAVAQDAENTSKGRLVRPFDVDTVIDGAI